MTSGAFWFHKKVAHWDSTPGVPNASIFTSSINFSEVAGAREGANNPNPTSSSFWKVAECQCSPKIKQNRTFQTESSLKICYCTILFTHCMIIIDFHWTFIWVKITDVIVLLADRKCWIRCENVYRKWNRFPMSRHNLQTYEVIRLHELATLSHSFVYFGFVCLIKICHNYVWT